MGVVYSEVQKRILQVRIGDQCFMDVFGFPWDGVGQGEDVIDQIIDLPPQLAGVGSLPQSLQLLLALLGDGLGFTETVKGGASLIIAAL